MRQVKEETEVNQELLEHLVNLDHLEEMEHLVSVVKQVLQV